MSRRIFFSDALQQTFNRDGIVAVPLLSEGDITALLDFYKAMSAGTPALQFHSTMFVNNAAYRRQTDAGIKATVLEKVNALVDNYRMLFANYIVKESSAQTAVGIHQDWNFTSPEYTSINIWIPLVDINERTGRFYAVKGSHKTFQNIRYTPYANNAYAHLQPYIFDKAAAFDVKAGQALIYHGGLVHFSDPNQSGHLRIAVGCALIPAEAPNLHYYKPDEDKDLLEVYSVNEAFYHGFDFYKKPVGVEKIKETEQYDKLPQLSALAAETSGYESNI